MRVDTGHISIMEPIGRVSGAVVVEEHHIEGREALSHFVRPLGVADIRMAAPLCFVPESARPRLIR